MICELQEQVTQQNEAVLPFIKHINALLQQAVTTCKAAQHTQPPSYKQSLLVKESIPPGKNCEHQWRFKQTSKTPGRKKSGLILRFAVMAQVHCKHITCVYLNISGMLAQMKETEFCQSLITRRYNKTYFRTRDACTNILINACHNMNDNGLGF